MTIRQYAQVPNQITPAPPQIKVGHLVTIKPNSDNDYSGQIYIVASIHNYKASCIRLFKPDDDRGFVYIQDFHLHQLDHFLGSITLVQTDH